MMLLPREHLLLRTDQYYVRQTSRDSHSNTNYLYLFFKMSMIRRTFHPQNPNPLLSINLTEQQFTCQIFQMNKISTNTYYLTYTPRLLQSTVQLTNKSSQNIHRTRRYTHTYKHTHARTLLPAGYGWLLKPPATNSLPSFWGQ